MAGPPVTGFSVRIGTAGTPASVPNATGFTARGASTPVDIGAGTRRLDGVLIGSVGSTPPSDATVALDGVTVLLAGELYHRDELRTAVGSAADGLGADQGGSDAELLAACWTRYGPPGLRLLDGRFAAVVVEDDTVVVATDHAGSVPVYLRADGGGNLLVATEAKVLAGPGPDLGPVPGTDPVFGPDGVRRVCAGTAVVLRGADTLPVAALRTWAPPEHRIVVPADEAVRRVRAALDAAVVSRMDPRGADVTVVLSGGIDSSSVAALAARAIGDGNGVHTVSLGTDAGNEFDAARLVADHLGTRHSEFRVLGTDLVHELPWAVAAAEIVDADVLEYLLPLVVLYRRLPIETAERTGRRVLTGYGADIPLGGMHRATRRLDSLDDVIAHDMATFDGLNEMSPVLGALAGWWTTHPFWDRGVLELLTTLEPGLKRRHDRDKWVLRESMSGLLPQATVHRSKLGIHEGSGTTSVWTTLLLDAGVAAEAVPAAKNAMSREIHRRVVGAGESPDQVSFDEVLSGVVGSGVSGEMTEAIR